MTTVWIKLYLHREDEEPSEFGIRNFDGDIDELKEEVKKKNANSLQNVDPAMLDVYRQGTQWPIEEGTEPLPIDSSPPEGTSANRPLIVVPRIRHLAPQQVSRFAVVVSTVPIC